MARILARILAVTLLVAVIPIGIAAAATHFMLDGTGWTDPQPTPAPASTAPPAATPSPAVASQWHVGACYTTRLRPADCAPGALQLVAVIHRPHPRPCTGITPHPDTRYRKGLALCLTRY